MSEQIKNARKIICEAFKEDIDFKNSYKADIAMTIYDNMLVKKISNDEKLQFANNTAEKIIDVIFSE